MKVYANEFILLKAGYCAVMAPDLCSSAVFHRDAVSLMKKFLEVEKCWGDSWWDSVYDGVDNYFSLSPSRSLAYRGTQLTTGISLYDYDLEDVMVLDDYMLFYFELLNDDTMFDSDRHCLVVVNTDDFHLVGSISSGCGAIRSAELIRFMQLAPELDWGI